MTMKWSMFLYVALVGCRSAPPQETMRSAARGRAMDSATVKRLCVAPDSVLAGHRSCELLDQRPRVKVF
jgi:hypothetical protein